MFELPLPLHFFGGAGTCAGSYLGCGGSLIFAAAHGIFSGGM